MSKQLEQILARIPADAPHAAEVREVVTAMFGAVEAFSSKAQVHYADKKLSRDGARSTALEALPGTIEAIKSYEAALTRLNAGLADNERSLHSKIARRPADVLTYAQHAEIRGYVAALTEASRLPFLMKHIDNADVREAVLGVPFPELAGMSGDKLEVFRTAVLEKFFSTELETIAAARETLEVGETGKALALQALQSAADITERDFAALIAGKAETPAKPRTGTSTGMVMSYEEFTALPESERRLLHKARDVRIDAYARREKWAIDKHEAEGAAFLWPPYAWG